MINNCEGVNSNHLHEFVSTYHGLWFRTLIFSKSDSCWKLDIPIIYKWFETLYSTMYIHPDLWTLTNIKTDVSNFLCFKLLSIVLRYQEIPYLVNVFVFKPIDSLCKWTGVYQFPRKNVNLSPMTSWQEKCSKCDSSST